MQIIPIVLGLIEYVVTELASDGNGTAVVISLEPIVTTTSLCEHVQFYLKAKMLSKIKDMLEVNRVGTNIIFLASIRMSLNS